MDPKKLHIPDAPKEQDCLIAYIDLMGTRERLKQVSESIFFGEIYYPFLFADRVVPALEKLGLQDLKIKIFSDNILFALPVTDVHNEEDILFSYRQLGSFLKLFLSMFVKKGILFRGAITLDTIMINELIVWGKGLLSVVDLEENVAIFPRIVLGEKLLRVFDQFGVTGEEYEEMFSCLIDSDECVFFDFFDYNSPDCKSLLEKAKSVSLQNIQNEKSWKNRPKILQKLQWFKNYVERAEEIFLGIDHMFGD